MDMVLAGDSHAPAAQVLALGSVLRDVGTSLHTDYATTRHCA
jgi:hypothetical protein